MFSVAEVNATPTLEGLSLVFQQAAAVGMTHAHVLRHLVDSTRCAGYHQQPQLLLAVCCRAGQISRAAVVVSGLQQLSLALSSPAGPAALTAGSE